MTLETEDKRLFKKSLDFEKKSFSVAYRRHEYRAQTEPFSREHVGEYLVTYDAGFGAIVAEAGKGAYITFCRRLFAVEISGQAQALVEPVNSLRVVV